MAKEQRGYQYGFSHNQPAMHDAEGRLRKARTMVAVLRDHLGPAVAESRVLDVGASTGIIDDHLAEHFAQVTGIDIDREAVISAGERFPRDNLVFREGDALAIEFPDATFDVVICSQVYEHVPDAARMMAEIHRVLRPGGVCYFAASNRLMWNEPHYNLPLLSVVPRPLAHHYVRLAGRAERYHELHLSYWGLRRLVADFEVIDYTRHIVEDPERFGADYMLPPGAFKTRVARFMVGYLPWLMPGYIWLLRKSPARG